MRFKYLIIGMILIILGFLAFSLIAVLNQYYWMNTTYHILITFFGFLLIGLGIICMIIFDKSDNKVEEKVKKVE